MSEAVVKKPKAKRHEIVNKTIQGAWHIAGGGKLPVLQHDIAEWLLTQVGETVSMLLALFKEGFKYEMRKDGTLEFVDIIVPAKSEKFDRLLELTKGNQRTRRLQFHNSYNIWWVKKDEKNPNNAYMSIRLYDSYWGTRNMPGSWINDLDLVDMIEFFGILKREPEKNGIIVVDNWSIEALIGHNEKIKKKARLQEVQDSANFLQAALTTYLDFNWKRIPNVVKGPALKQAAEQLLCYVGLLRDGEKPSFPSVEDRDPEGRVLEWQDAVREIAGRTTPFEYTTAREHDPRKFSDSEDKRGNRLVNVSEDWAKFSTSPFPRRMSLKLTPENSVVYRRIWKESCGETRKRLYIAVPVFKGLTDNDKNRLKFSDPKIFWWHSRLSEFIPMPLWQKSMGKKAWLTPNHDTILIALEYDLQKDGSSRFEKTLCDTNVDPDRPTWEICLSTLCERRVRSGAQSFDGNTLHHFPTYFRSDLSVGFDLKDTGIPERILALHFSDDPVITWVLGDIKAGEGRILETGQIEGNQILDEALTAQVRLEEEAGKLRWTGGKQFRGILRNRTNELSNFIVNLAIEKGAHIALEKINWVNKRSGDAPANRRFSMWNYSALGKRIEWLGIEVQKRRDDGKSAPLCAYVNDYVIKALYKRANYGPMQDTPEPKNVPNQKATVIVFTEAVKRLVALAEKREKSV